MSTVLLGMPPLLPTTPPSLNLSSLLTSRDGISQLSIRPTTITPFRPTSTFPTIIRNGGGPRTFPGGVSKWQWKRMQAKKQKQLLKARLCRERQIYEMRKRAELRAAVSELERPWEVVERAPALFSVSADEQLKTLADRFQRPGGYDLWSERDGPQLFHTSDGLPSARFLPHGAVHSVKPYGVRGGEMELRDENEGKLYNGNKRRVRKNGSRGSSGIDGEAFPRNGSKEMESGLNNLRISSGREERGGERDEVKGRSRGGLRNKGVGRKVESRNSYGSDSKQGSYDTEKNGTSPQPYKSRIRSNVRSQNSGRDQRKTNDSHTREVYDMSLKQDGSYELQANQHKSMFSSGDLEDEFELDLTSWSQRGS